jgi:hypothetical protein
MKEIVRSWAPTASFAMPIGAALALAPVAITSGALAVALG